MNYEVIYALSIGTKISDLIVVSFIRRCYVITSFSMTSRLCHLYVVMW